MAENILTWFSSKYRQYSGVDFLRRTYKWAFRKIGINIETYNYFVTYLQDYNAIPKIPQGFEIKKLEIDDIACSQIIKFSGAQKQLFQLRINDPFYESYGFITDGKLVYYFNISLKSMECPLPDGTISLENDEGLLVDGYCHPDFRGLGLHTAMSVYLLGRLKQLGKKRAVTFIIDENKGARKSQEKIGFKLKKKFVVVEIFKRTYIKTNNK